MSTHNAKHLKIAQVIEHRFGGRPKRMLVVGCGSGSEAATLGKELGAHVIGIDLKDNFDYEAAAQVELRVADATSLPFEDECFDFVYSYHALEHIPDFRQALREMRRVLSRSGGWYIGTPNRSRFAGYIGNDEVPLRDKLRWNLIDWKMRAKGRFKNEYGAHAGFTEAELRSELVPILGPAHCISIDYYLAIYPGHQSMINFIGTTGLGRWVFPSVYFMSTQRRDDSGTL